jgi:choline kinase
MARNIINEPFVLVESDLVFDLSQFDYMIFPDRIAIAPMAPWMNGSSVLINQFNIVKNFVNSNSIHLGEIRYKTVNIYSFSLSTWHAIIEILNEYIAANNVNCYYETVFGEMIENGNLSLQTVLFDNKLWCEIDTIEDLVEAEKLFPAEIYENENPDKIILQSNNIPDKFVKKTTALESQKVAS